MIQKYVTNYKVEWGQDSGFHEGVMFPKDSERFGKFRNHSVDFITLHRIWGQKYNINPRPDGGGGVESPLWFFEDSEKRRHAAPPFFAYLTSHSFRTFSENVVPKSTQVMSPGQVK